MGKKREEVEQKAFVKQTLVGGQSRALKKVSTKCGHSKVPIAW